MQTAPTSKYQWTRASFIGLACVSVLSSLATRAYGDVMILGRRWEQLASLAGISTALLLLAAVVCLFIKSYRRLAVLGFLVTAFYFLTGILLPTGGIRF